MSSAECPTLELLVLGLIPSRQESLSVQYGASFRFLFAGGESEARRLSLLQLP